MRCWVTVTRGGLGSYSLVSPLPVRQNKFQLIVNLRGHFMGKRGPNPSSSRHIVERVKNRYPNPQPGMTQNARTVWHRIVRSFEPDHFKPYQYDLLRTFCEASASHKKAIFEIKIGGEVIEQTNGVIKESPWVGVAIKMSAQMATLSSKLGLNINSTLANRGKAGKATEPKSKRDGLLFGGKSR